MSDPSNRRPGPKRQESSISFSAAIGLISDCDKKKVYKALVTIRTKYIKEKDGLARFRQHGGLDQLLSVIPQWTNQNLLDIAFSVLGNCCMEEKTRKRVLMMGGIETMGTVLKVIDVASIQNRVCRTLGNLALDTDCCHAIHVQEELLGVIIRLLDTTEDNEAQQTYLRTIRLLGDTQKHRKAIIEADGLRIMARHISSDTDAVVSAALKSVVHMTQELTTDHARQLLAVDAPATMVKLTTHSDPARAKQAVAIIMAWVKQEELCTGIGSGGGIDLFLENIQQGGIEANIDKKFGLVNALCLSCREVANRVKIREKGGLVVLLKLLIISGYHKIHDRIISALLSYLYDDKSLDILLANGLVPTIVSHLRRCSRTGCSDVVAVSGSLTVGSITDPAGYQPQRATPVYQTDQEMDMLESFSMEERALPGNNNSSSLPVQGTPDGDEGKQSEIHRMGISLLHKNATEQVVSEDKHHTDDDLDSKSITRPCKVESLHCQVVGERIDVTLPTTSDSDPPKDKTNPPLYSIDSPTYQLLSEWKFDDYSSGPKNLEDSVAYYSTLSSPDRSSSLGSPTRTELSYSPLSMSSSFISPSWSPASSPRYSVSPTPSSPPCSMSPLLSDPSSPISFSASTSPSFSLPDWDSPSPSNTAEEDPFLRWSPVHGSSEPSSEEATTSVAWWCSAKDMSDRASDSVKRDLFTTSEQIMSADSSMPTSDLEIVDMNSAIAPKPELNADEQSEWKDSSVASSSAGSNATTSNLMQGMRLSSTPDRDQLDAKHIITSKKPSLAVTSDIGQDLGFESVAVVTATEPDAEVKKKVRLLKKPELTSSLSTEAKEQVKKTLAKQKTLKKRSLDIDTLMTAPSPRSFEVRGEDINPEFKKPTSPRKVTEMNILVLLSRISFFENPTPHLLNTDCVSTLLDYFVKATNPYPRCKRILHRLTRNTECFEPIIMMLVPSLIFKKLAGSSTHESDEKQHKEYSDHEDSSHECSGKSSRSSIHRKTPIEEVHAFRNQLLENIGLIAESKFGRGNLAHILLTGEETNRTKCALMVPYLCRSKRMWKKLLLDYGGLECIKHVLMETSTDNSSAMQLEAISSLEHLAASLKIPIFATSSENQNIKNDDPPGMIFGADSMDLQFVLDDSSQVLANRKMMVQASSVFAAMLEGHYSESRQSSINVSDATNASFQLVVQFAHTGSLNLDSIGTLACTALDVLLDTLVLADRFLMSDLQSLLTNLLSSQAYLNINSVLRICYTSIQHGAHQLLENCLKYILCMPECLQRKVDLWGEIAQGACSQVICETIFSTIEKYIS